tara:strand:+ start:1414 stop:2631 length:1218 start_codon:yes stop_codon:yes gene_type:complete
MTKVKEKQNIPKGWERKTLSELGVLTMGQSPSGTSYSNNQEDYPLLNGAVELKKNGICIHQYTNAPTRLCNVGDLLFCIRATIGNLQKANREYCLGRGVAALNVYKKYSSEYVEQQLEDLFTLMRYRAHGGVIKGLKKDEIANFDVLVPKSKAEQQKIAEILVSVDEDIEKTKEVIKATEKLKKGLMQKLFTRGIGHTKFKQTELGEIPESWDVVSLEDVAQLSTGTTPSTSKKSYYQGEVAFIKTGQVVNNRIDSAETHVSENAVSDYRLKKYKPGTVLMAMYGQGKTRGQVALLEIEACTTQNAAAIEMGNKLHSEYLWFFFKSQYERLRQGGVQGHISHLNLTILKRYKLALPSLVEQEKIVEILVSVDEKIKVNEKLLAKQTELKKGLMQDLLSGTKRVKI